MRIRGAAWPVLGSALERYDHGQEIAAWETALNAAKATIHWQFTLDKARKKFKRLYHQNFSGWLLDRLENQVLVTQLGFQELLWLTKSLFGIRKIKNLHIPGLREFDAASRTGLYDAAK